VKKEDIKSNLIMAHDQLSLFALITIGYTTRQLDKKEDNHHPIVNGTLIPANLHT
jgi:hypothetical protein